MRLRTGYSFRVAVGTIDEAMGALVMTGEDKFAPITDRASAYGWVKWKAAAKKAGLAPVFGVELAVSPDPKAQRPVADYWLFYPNGKKGLTELNRLITTATDQFRYQPLLSYGQAVDNKLIKVVGHRSDISLIRPKDNRIYVGLSPAVAPGYARRVVDANLSWIATGDNYYPTRKDQGLYEVIAGRNASSQTYPQHILRMEEWEDSVRHLPLGKGEAKAAWKASRKALGAASRCGLGRASLPVPAKPESLSSVCRRAAKRLGVDLSNPVYKKRLKKELDLIREKDFEDYFYIVADIVSWARERMLVGPARGSSCGSLVCYLLGITTVDPIPYGLIFERFIDVNRNDLPDIDIDFSDAQRGKVIRYIRDTYGPEHVATLGTVALYRPRSALTEAAAALDIPKWEVAPILDALIERSSGDARALDTLEDTLNEMPAAKELLERFPSIKIGCRMEGHPRHASTHASGVVLNTEPLARLAPVDLRNGPMMMDKADAEEIGLLKIDVLGLTQLSIIEDAIQLAGIKREELEALPFTDKRVYKTLRRRRFTGIFQWNGFAIQSVTTSFRVEEFNDIVSIIALARPGPLASGNTAEWIARRNKKKPVTYPHKSFREYLSDTYGVVLYQEQVMNIGREIGGLDWGQVTALRKAMSKTLGKEYFDQFGDPWKEGARKKGVDPKILDETWDDLCAYGSFAFNKSHCVAYAVITYWCCWLKTYFPFEFAAATLNYEQDIDRQRQILRELEKEGYGYVPVDPATSTDRWSITGKGKKRKLLGPLSNIRGVGPKTVQTIIGARNRGEPVPESARKRMTNPRTDLDSLYPVRDATARLMPDPKERNIHSEPIPIEKLLAKAVSPDTDVLVIATPAQINIRDKNETVLVARRGHRIEDGPTQYLNLRIQDDTGLIFANVSVWDYEKMGRPIVNRGRAGKAIYAFKGVYRENNDFQMVIVETVRYIGDIDEDHREDEDEYYS